jgi:mono/diheme cytochrome c family protein
MRGIRVMGVAAMVLICSHAAAQTPPGPSRGQLLYGTHCVECHNTQVHWRDSKLATDWVSLKALVRRWQARALLEWSEADIVAVTRHLNDTIYRYRQTTDLLGMALPLRYVRLPAG